MATVGRPWSFAVGRRGRPHRVTVRENAQRGGVLALHWFIETSEGRVARYQSLGRMLRTADGKVVREIERWARAQAQTKHEALARGETDALAPLAIAPLTILEAKLTITDERTGKYPKPSAHRRETLTALNFACTVWGSQRAWDTIRRADIRALGRARVEQLKAAEHVGMRGAEITVQRVLTVAQWLRDEELITEDACVPSTKWRQELRGYWAETHNEPEAPTPARPRHTIEEFRRIIAAADQIDPRLGLLLAVGAELRLGQVARSKRSHVDLASSEFVVPSKGKKRGAVVKMTSGQTTALIMSITTGYLRELEAALTAGIITDYPLFPSGQLPGARVVDGIRKSKGPITPTATIERHARATPIHRRTITELFELAEARAGVKHLPGRGAYGLRRVAVDAAKQMGISREGLKEHGGWTDTQMPDMVYADQDAEKPREEARDVRAAIRGEQTTEPTENASFTQQTRNSAPKHQGAVA